MKLFHETIQNNLVFSLNWIDTTDIHYLGNKTHTIENLQL